MYGDTDVIHGLARAMRDRADDIRREADRLVARAEAVRWEGLAADAMRDLARHRAAALRRTATLHGEAAEALDRHAREVRRLQELIAAVERRVRRLVDAARDRLSSLGGILAAVADPVDRILDSFVPPPHGHKAWLDVELPGLDR